MNKSKEYNVHIYYTDEEVNATFKKFYDEVNQQSKVHVFTKNAGTFSHFTKDSNLNVYSQGGIFEKLKAWISGDDRFEQHFDALKINNESRKEYKKIINNGGTIIFSTNQIDSIMPDAATFNPLQENDTIPDQQEHPISSTDAPNFNNQNATHEENLSSKYVGKPTTEIIPFPNVPKQENNEFESINTSSEVVESFEGNENVQTNDNQEVPVEKAPFPDVPSEVAIADDEVNHIVGEYDKTDNNDLQVDEPLADNPTELQFRDPIENEINDANESNESYSDIQPDTLGEGTVNFLLVDQISEPKAEDQPFPRLPDGAMDHLGALLLQQGDYETLKNQIATVQHALQDLEDREANTQNLQPAEETAPDTAISTTNNE